VGAPYEYRILDGSKGPLNFAAAYNWAASQAQGDIIVFIDDVCYFMSMNWGAALEAKFSGDPTLCVAGVAGTQYLFRDKYSWTAAGRPFIKGRLVYHLQNNDFFAVAFSVEKGDYDVVACDGCVLAVRTETARNVKFDDTAFTGEHFWDLDFCVRARTTGRVVVTSDITVKRMEQQVYGEEWQKAGRRFLLKHQNELPLACAEYPGVPLPGPGAQIVTLRGKYSPETIC
jgi:GT2 family glycosyltransferase